MRVCGFSFDDKRRSHAWMRRDYLLELDALETKTLDQSGLFPASVRTAG
jgi:hypothetical protein